MCPAPSTNTKKISCDVVIFARDTPWYDNHAKFHHNPTINGKVMGAKWFHLHDMTNNPSKVSAQSNHKQQRYRPEGILKINTACDFDERLQFLITAHHLDVLSHSKLHHNLITDRKVMARKGFCDAGWLYYARLPPPKKKTKKKKKQTNKQHYRQITQWQYHSFHKRLSLHLEEPL